MKDPENISEILDTRTFLPEEVRKSGKPGQYFEQKLVDRCKWTHLDDDQYLIM